MTKLSFGLKFRVKCYHPEEEKSYECEPIEEDVVVDDYQGFRCPKCKHEIGLIIEQYYFEEDVEQ